MYRVLPVLVPPGWQVSGAPRVSSRWMVPQLRRQPHTLGPGTERGKRLPDEAVPDELNEPADEGGGDNK